MGNIVWIASYPKSGNTWIRAFIENYLQNSSRPVELNQLHQRSISESESSLYQAQLSMEQKLADLDTESVCKLRTYVHSDIARNAQGTTFVKTHNFQGQYKGIPLHNASVSSGAIYVLRNPLDVVVSMSNYFGLTIDQAIDFMADDMTGTPMEDSHVPQIISSWSKHVESWTEHKEKSVLVLRYEDLVSNSLKSFRKIESFLNLKKDPKRLKQAILNSSFNKLRDLESQKGFVEKHENAARFFNKGRPNQWKEVLTDEQVDKVVEQHFGQMKNFKYLPK